MLVANDNGPGRSDLLAYLDRFSYPPGASITVHAGTAGESTPVQIGLAAPRWHDVDQRVQVTLEPLSSAPAVASVTDPAPIHPGSYFVVEGVPSGLDRESTGVVSYGAYAWSGHLSPAPSERILTVSSSTHQLTVDLDEGHLVATIEVGREVRTIRADTAVPGRTWFAFAVSLDLPRGRFTLAERLSPRTAATVKSLELDDLLASDQPWAEDCLLVWAASNERDRPSFNGKLESPTVVQGPGVDVLDLLDAAGDHDGLLGRWDLWAATPTGAVRDLSSRGRHGTLVNAPTLAVTGSRWTGDVLSAVNASDQYGAVHFHSDDLDDAGYAAVATLRVPDDAEPGLYAVTITSADGRQDHVPFVVTTDQPADVVFLASTFTYLAYANNSLSLDLDYEGKGISSRPIVPCERELTLRRNRQVGKSQYDRHPDGSGVAHSSGLRPILNFRYDFQSAIQEAPRNFSADFLIYDWLCSRHGSVAVTTDHEIHRTGAVPSGTKVLVTGTHPEYCSREMLDAFQTFVDRGGSIMYLGGNGFYWVTTCAPETPHRTEVRRGHAGIRTWESAPGEVHHATTGEFGGLWRYRGRFPNKLFGVGTTAQGFDEKAPGYKRAPEAVGPLADLLLGDLSAHAHFGDFGYAMGGAAGDELDRMDPDLGTPATALRLLTSTGHSASYMLAVEDVDMIVAGLDGTTDERVRSDVCILPMASGGYVFSVGSIAWACAMAWNQYDNEVAELTARVLDLLLSPSTTR